MGMSAPAMLAEGVSPQAAKEIASATESRGVDRLLVEPVGRGVMLLQHLWDH